MRLEIQPRALAHPPAVAVVLDPAREPVVRFRGALPVWVAADVGVMLRHDDGDAQPTEWTGKILAAPEDDGFVTVTDLGAAEAVDRRRAGRPSAPVPIEWSQPPAVIRRIGVGLDLNRLGVRFRVDSDAVVRTDRIVLAVLLPSGAITVQGRVVGVRGTEVRAEFVALHPEALRRLVEWEAAALGSELTAASPPDLLGP
ncbi:MAG: hypothetical protein AAGF02_06900 [Actinomycetota bacterium]